MSDPKMLRAATLASERQQTLVVEMPSGGTLNWSRTETLVEYRESISRELMMLGMQNATAAVEMTKAKYESPAKQQTVQVATIGGVIVLVVAMAMYALLQKPDAMWAIAEIVTVVGVVFGGMYVGGKYIQKKHEPSDVDT